MEDTAWAALAEAHLPMMYRLAMSLTRHRADAEDAVQSALLKSWQHRHQARTGRETAWLMRILINECYTLLRRKRTLPLEDAADVPAPPAPDHSLRESIDQLPEKLRTPLLLKYMEGMTEREIADTLRIPVSSVKNRLFRARKALKALLNEEVAP